MEKKTKEIQNNGMVKVVLRCGRNMSSEMDITMTMMDVVTTKILQATRRLLLVANE